MESPSTFGRMGRSDGSRELGTPALGQLYDDLLPMARRARSRGEAIAKRFVSRQQHHRIQPFVERWRWVIEGRVQRVGFRASCSRRALDLGISGWVRNQSDGSVEVQAEGPPLALSELRAWCEVGPPGARVLRVKPSQLPVTGDDWFEVRY